MYLKITEGERRTQTKIPSPHGIKLQGRIHWNIKGQTKLNKFMINKNRIPHILRMGGISSIFIINLFIFACPWNHMEIQKKRSAARQNTSNFASGAWIYILPNHNNSKADDNSDLISRVHKITPIGAPETSLHCIQTQRNSSL